MKSRIFQLKNIWSNIIELISKILIFSILINPVSCRLDDNQVRGNLGSQSLPLELVTKPLNINANQSFTFTLTGGSPPYTFQVESGEGTIDSTTGVFQAPWSLGATTVKAVDSAGQTYSHSFNLLAARPVGTPNINFQLTQFQLSPNQNQLVYLADEDGDSNDELFVSGLDGSNKIQLNTGGNVEGFEMTSDNQYMVFMADQDTTGVVDLYSIRTDGTSMVKINGTLINDYDVLNFKISPNNQYVVFTIKDNIDNKEYIYSTNVVSQNALQLNSSMVTGGANYGTFKILSNNSTVVYLADQDLDDALEIFKATIGSAGSSLKLNVPLVSALTGIWKYWITPDELKVVYYGEPDDWSDQEIYSVNLDLSNRVQLNVQNGLRAVYMSPVILTQDSTQAIIQSDLDANGAGQLYSVTIGTAFSQIRLGTATINGTTVYEVQLSPDNTKVYYIANHDDQNFSEIYSATVGGVTSAVKLNNPLLGASSTITNMVPSTDFSQVYYLGDEDNDEVYEIYSASLDTVTSSTRLNDPLAPGRTITYFKFSPDRSKVVYRADKDQDDVYELYVMNATGGGTIKLSPTPVTGGDVTANTSEVLITNDNQKVIYSGDLETDGQIELYSVNLDGTQHKKLNGTIQALGGNVSTWILNSTQDRLIMSADQFTDNLFELFTFSP